jgi:hypothetical protein
MIGIEIEPFRKLFWVLPENLGGCECFLYAGCARDLKNDDLGGIKDTSLEKFSGRTPFVLGRARITQGIFTHQ